jgi:hypothetical protein
MKKGITTVKRKPEDESPKRDKISENIIETETPDGETFEVYEKIDEKKNLQQNIEDDFKNFNKPKNEIEFIENQIKLDYIISEKYKKKEINDKFDKMKKYKNYPAMKDLLMFYEKKKCKVYIDESIGQELSSQLQKYYSNENIFKNKIRIHLSIGKEKIKDLKVIKSIIDKVVKKISTTTNIPENNLKVTNVRKNCLLFDIFYICRRINKFIISIFDEGNLGQHTEELRQFLENIEREMGNNILMPEDIQRKIEIRRIIDHIVFNPRYYFNERFNKGRGDFGLRHFLFIPYHKESIDKNGRTYYYPNENYEGYGLKVHCNVIENNHFCCQDIFDPRGDWCIAYTNLIRSKISYRVNNVRPEVLYDNNNRGYRLVYQCKIKRSKIENDRGDLITLSNNDYIIPYRLLKEYIDN